MAVDPSNSMTYFLCIAAAHKDYLGAIRHWDKLEMAVHEASIWVKDLTQKQVDAVEVKSIPYKELYYALDQQLFPMGSMLPAGDMPALHWTSIEKGLPVQLPAFNHNYFGIHSKIEIKLVSSNQEKAVCALLVETEDLKKYIETAPAVRLKNLHWALVGYDRAVILGTPLLPLKGEACWRHHDFLLPAGYNFELHALTGTINQLVNPEGKDWIVWNKKGEYWKLDKELLKPLSIGSFRVSLKQLYGLA
ncbi:MAG: hypothetical protein INR73_23445 [Williamsia sp.]|nr:hypothetical protein [Williamsia sp.]